MKDRVPKSRDHRDTGEAGEGMRHRDAGKAEADHEQTAGEDGPCAVAIDREARPHLRQAGDAVEGPGQQADIGIAETDFLPNDQEHRREGELIEMAGAVGNADQADHPDVMLKRRGGCSGHEDLVSSLIIGDPPCGALAEMRGEAMRT